ncbi:MAG: 1,4-alpha-glucan branching protein GlgB [Christensenellaceae bacterium]|nr:1,4-alpha-glucan branching protein GlgB [Christensenellaceae bacterium]
MNSEYELPVYLFHQGTNFNTYEFLGSHFGEKNGKPGVWFRVWAPNAIAVSVVGAFNFWNTTKNPMEQIGDTGIFEAFIPKLKKYDTYKYAVTSERGTVFKADPYAFHSETPSGTASKIYSLDGFKWSDGEYLALRENTDIYTSPVNIYEVHAGSWKRNADGSYYSYRQMAKELVKYVKEMGYTHIEFMPLSEYPFDGSWGYQVTGYYSITSRFGTPHDFMYLVNECHRHGLGVIMDWVPAHFPKDEHGLIEFDGQPLYENKSWDRIEHRQWGTRRFDYGRTEVQSFLISNAVFLFDKYHIDGLRVDAVASMLYLDYDKKPGEWLPNQYGTNKNLEAIAFLKKLNAAVFERFPHAIMAAEESTAWPMVTKPQEVGGLGFNFKWNMGWMNDTLTYMQTDAYFRKYEHNKLTFPMMYAFSENFILPVSHDEVVYGKRSLIDKMPCSYDDKFANVRAFMAYMMSHPGKKLIFMGCEFGQFKEWDFGSQLEFFMLGYEKHRQLKDFFKEINLIYKNSPALYKNDSDWDGFEWIVSDDRDNNVIAYSRKDGNGNVITVIINFSGIARNGYRIGVDEGKYKVILNTDLTRFGGEGKNAKRVYNTVKKGSHGKTHSICVDLNKFSALYLQKAEQ